ncbi:hypothetical protein [Variovorax sp. ZT4R33]|uniref:hypothetical protein n=1 Tax=Variovorax sp. ZT4R33 TaxID=3443743 RepID=UPI003F45C1D3
MKPTSLESRPNSALRRSFCVALKSTLKGVQFQKWKSKKLFFTLICLVSLLVHSGELRREGGNAYAKGPILTSDAKELDVDGLNAIVFQDSLGGTMEAARAYIELIKRRKLRTIVKGKCFSACALAFLAGSRRSATEGVNNMIVLHVARVIENGVARPSNKNDITVALIRELTGGKITPEVLEKIAISWGEASGVVFSIGPGWFGARKTTLYCDGSQGLDTSKCSYMFNADPFEMGILTE